MTNTAEDLNKYSWFVQNATRVDAETFLGRCEHGRFIVRPSSMAGCLALSHKLPTLDIGHALIQSTPSGWTITGSDKSFPTVEGLLRSRTLTFPKPGEYGAPGQMTVQYPSQGRVSAAADLANVEPTAAPAAATAVTSPAQRGNGPPGRAVGGGMANSGQMARTPAATATPPPAAQPVAPAPVAFENNEALEKVLTCLVNPNNVTLELFSMNLTSLPSEVNDLHLLQSLYLSNNCFSELPREVLSLSALKTLWIQANNLTSLPPEIERLVNLEKLKVSNNTIDARTGFPAEMARMTNLHEVWIENNKLDVFPPTLLTVTSIKRIWVDHNQVREIPRTIGRLVNLERLSMNKNLVQEVPREIGNLKNLEKLWLNDNEVHTVAAEISLCSKLQMLALANNRIANAPDLSMLQFLTDLRLENNPCFNETLHGSAPQPNSAPFQPSNSPTIGAGGTTRRASGPSAAGTPGLGTVRGYTGAPAALATGGAAGGPTGAPTPMGTAASSSDHQRVKKVTSSFKLPWQKREDNPLMALNEAIEASDDKKVKAVMKSRKKSPFDLTALDSDGLTPLNKAVKLGDERVVDAIVSSSSLAPDEVNIRDKFGYTPLHWAVRGTNDAILNKLLEVKSIRVDVQNNDQNTPLHYFCEKNHSPDCERIGKMLIDKGALVNKTNNNGETPLHKAIFNTQVRLMMVRLLINNHADVNLLTQQRQSPLQYAVRLQREDLVTMLLKAGARLDLRSSDGLTAHEVAVKERCDKIAALLAECEKLQHWLAALDFERFFPVFVREEILFEQLPDLREDVLTKLGITTAGQRMKLMKAVQELRTERALHTMAAKERAAQLDQPPSFASNAGNAEGEWLQQLTAGMDLREGEHIAFTDIELLEELGSGAAGKVYKGLYKGKHVAVKVLKELKDGAELEDFKKELEIMTSIRSPYMIFFYGVVLSPKLCIAEGALVQLAHGGSCAIEHLDELRGALVAAPRVVAGAGDVRLARAACSRALDNGVKQCVRVALEDGRTLDCTPDHELLTADGRWLRADRLKPGIHRVAVAPQVPVADVREPELERAFRLAAGSYVLSMRDAAARNQALAFARILGFCYAGGSLNLKNGQVSVRHALDCDALVADAAHFDGCSRTIRADGMFVVQFHARLVEALCTIPRIVSDFALPDVLFAADTPTAFVREFVAAVFGVDGCAPLVCNNVIDHVYLTHASVKDHNNTDVRVYMTKMGQLLERCGVADYLLTNDSPSRQIRLVLRDSWAFAQAIGFRYNVQKSERLALAAVALRRDRLLSKKTVRATRKARTAVPYDELFESVGGGDWFDKEHITSKHDADEPTLGLLVRSVTALGARRVFDLTVPGPHAFVANGIAVHNCMVMEIATRKSLFHVLNRDGLAIGWPQALEWGAQAAGGTACLHQHNIVHRDLKSLNLLVTQDWVIKVADFGLARFNNECFDAVDHQLLTGDGFLFLDEVLERVEWRVVGGRIVVTDWKGLTAATYNPKTAQLVYRQPLALGVNWGEQNFVEIGTEAYAPKVDWATRTDQVGSHRHAAVSVVATGNHDMYVSKGSRADTAGKARMIHTFDKVALGRLPDLGYDSVRLLAAPSGGVALDGAAVPAPLQVLNLDRKGAQPNGQLLDEAATCAQVALFLRVFGFWLGHGSLRVPKNAMPLVQFTEMKLRDHVFLRQAFVKFGLIAIKDSCAMPLNSEDEAQWCDDQSAVSRWWNDDANFAAIEHGGVSLCRMADERDGAVKVYQIADERWARFFATEYATDGDAVGSGKWFPEWVLRELSAKGLRNVVWGLHLADGASAGKSMHHIWTSSVLMRDQLEVVLLRAGFSPSTTFARHLLAQWRVSWATDNATEPTVHLKRVAGDTDVYERIRKSGISWCFDMQSVVGANDGFVVVRRAARLSVDDVKCAHAAINQRLSNTIDSLSAQAQSVGVAASDDVAIEKELRGFGASARADELGRKWVVFAASRPTIQGNSNLETLNKMRGTMAYCVPEEHEILTNRGFMDLETYTTRAARDKGLLVASYDKRNDTMTFEKPQRLIVQPHQTRTLVELSAASESVDTWAEAAGDFGVVGGRGRGRDANGVSLLVTREHHLYAQFGGVDGGLRTTWADAPYEKIEAGDFLDNDVHRRSGAKLHALRQKTAAASGYDGPNKPRSVADVYALAGVGAAAGGSAASAPLALFYELYGYWLGDGSFDVSARVATFGNVRDVAWLRATLTALFGAEQWRVRDDGATFEVLDARWNELIGAEYGRRFADAVDCSGDDKRELRALQRVLKERRIAGEPRAQRAERWAAAKAESESAAASAPLCAPTRRAASSDVQLYDEVSSAAGSFVACEADTSAKWTAWWVWTLDCEAVRGVIRGVQRADGARANKSSTTVLTSSARFRDELVRLCYQAGYTVRFECEQRGVARDVWAVRWCDERASATQREPLLHPVLQKARGDVRERVYTGRVWCFTMPSGFIWTRRAHKDERGVVTKASRALLTGQCPPEAYFAQPFDYKSDVYSLAVILWELANRALKGKYEAPFSEYKNLTMDFQIIIQVAKSHLRPTIPERCPQPVRALIEKSWVFEREERPDADQVQQELRQLITVYESESPAWDATIGQSK